MREIKFRAWDLRNKEWVPGGVGFHVIGEAILLGGLFQDWSLQRLGDVELMQFTGLRDRNGKEIFEDDIFRDRRGNIRDVHWGEREAGWCTKCLSDKGHHPEFDNERITYGSTVMYDAEVIGNIHENPELVK